jgi:hypothetical protein
MFFLQTGTFDFCAGFGAFRACAGSWTPGGRQEQVDEGMRGPANFVRAEACGAPCGAA